MNQEREDVRHFLRHAVPFVLVGLVLYAGLYAASEWLIGQYGQRNRFFMVKTAPHGRYDHVLLGASRAAVFDYREMNARLERMTGQRILNLSIVGAGVTVNRLLLEYFLVRHDTASVVYFVDSFVFYSPQWNEERLQDAQLFQRAPFDPALARLLFEHPVPSLTALDYLVGFSKINNPGRFQPDVHPDEGARFDRTYRPVAQIDRQRLAYLYPHMGDDSAKPTGAWYLAEFDDLVRRVKSAGIRFVAIKPPTPDRMRRLVPGETDFDAVLTKLLERRGAEFHDFSLAGNDETFFYDSDHLNQSGVLHFFESHLRDVLVRTEGITLAR